jgi:hypothetical protein
VRDLGEFLRDVYPRTPGIGVAGEPVAFGPAFRTVEAIPREPATAPMLGADNDLLVHTR